VGGSDSGGIFVPRGVADLSADFSGSQAGGGDRKVEVLVRLRRIREGRWGEFVCAVSALLRITWRGRGQFFADRQKKLDRKAKWRYFAVTSDVCLPDGGSFTERERVDMGHDEDKSQNVTALRLVGLVSFFTRP
jgi:hypothetical protein